MGAKKRPVRRALAVPDKEARCQECQMGSDVYVPCNKPAEFIVRNSDPKQYTMCGMCADHNIKNRGASLVYADEQFDLYVPSKTLSPKPAKPKVDANLDSGLAVSLDYVVRGMAKFKERIDADLAVMVRAERPSPELVQVYATLRAMSDAVDTATKPLYAAVDKMGGELIPAAFERDNMTTLTTDNGFRVTVSSRLFASILKEQRDAAFDWMRKNGMGDLIQPTVNAGTLSAEAKVLLEQGKELPEALFSTFYKPTTSLTKVKVK